MTHVATRRILGAAVWLGALCVAVPVSAQSVTLRLSTSLISFSAGDPDSIPVVTAPVVTVTYRVRNNYSYWNWQITVQAAGDLSSGSVTIPASAITWTATPSPPFRSGTLSRASAQLMANGSGNIDPSRTAQVTFALANSWAYNVGTYSTSLNFTITCP